MNVVAALFAVDPSGLGGVALRSPAGPAREEWLTLLEKLLPASAPVRRVPLNINDAALLGGLDLGATLSAGRPIAQQGQEHAVRMLTALWALLRAWRPLSIRSKFPSCATVLPFSVRRVWVWWRLTRAGRTMNR